jgi:hypothetical protein
MGFDLWLAWQPGRGRLEGDEFVLEVTLLGAYTSREQAVREHPDARVFHRRVEFDDVEADSATFESMVDEWVADLNRQLV